MRTAPLNNNVVHKSFIHMSPALSGAAPPSRVVTPTLLLMFVVACLALASCSRSHDFGAFVVNEVGRCGGRALTNAPLPRVEAEWTIRRDRNGFQASISGATFTSIDGTMKQAFGAPKLSKESNASGYPHRVWAAADIGVAIHLIGRANGAEITCMRGMRNVDEMMREIERPWWKIW